MNPSDYPLGSWVRFMADLIVIGARTGVAPPLGWELDHAPIPLVDTPQIAAADLPGTFVVPDGDGRWSVWWRFPDQMVAVVFIPPVFTVGWEVL